MCGQTDDIHSTFWIIKNIHKLNWIILVRINSYIRYWISIYQSLWYLQKIAASLTFLFMFILLIFLLFISLEIQICWYPFMDEQISFQFNLHYYCYFFLFILHVKYFLTVNFKNLFFYFRITWFLFLVELNENSF